MNRKTFFQSGLAGTAMLAAPGLVRAQKRELSNKTAAPTGVKISDVKGYYFKKAHFVKIETDSGISGWGESDGANKLFTSSYIRKQLREYIIGRDPFDSEGIWHDTYMLGIEAGTSGIHPGAICGIDNALWDLKGKLLGMPVHKLLGGNGKERVQVYGSYGRFRDGRYDSPEEMARRAMEFVDQGYQAVKARMQIRQENVNPYPDDVYQVVAAIRAAIGDDILLYIDFNNGYTPAEATMLGLKLYEHFNIAALEEPVFQQDYSGLGQVAQDLPIPVMAGEHEYNKWMVRDLLTIGKVDIVNLDVIKCGGLTECRKSAAMVHAFGKQVMVHNAKPTLATAASLNLLTSIPNGTRFQEYAGKRLPEYAQLYELFENYFEFKEGYLYLTGEPGLGLVVNEKAMEKLGQPG